MTPQRRTLAPVADGVWVATSRQDSTTSTIVVHDAQAFLIDPAWLPDELSGLAGEISHRGWTVTAGFSTHAHHDHLLWHPGFGAPPRWASPRTCELADRHRDELLRALGAGWPRDLAAAFGRVSPLAGTALPSPFGAGDTDEEFEVVTHDGHAPGHSALWLPERRVLVAGDMLSDVELPLPFCPDDLPSYLAALDVLAPYVEKARVLIPGHGTPTADPGRRLDADRRYLEAVLGGRAAKDRRRELPGMAENHRRLIDLARRSGIRD